MAHNRPHLALRAVNALKQINFGMETRITLSDNPSSDRLCVRDVPAGIEYIRHSPMLDVQEHAVWVWKHFDGEWSLLTHDDDEMHMSLGDHFRKFSKDPEISMITGKSRIVKNESPIEDYGYLQRLESAGLLGVSGVVRDDLQRYLFDLGSLFPASAMIVRTNSYNFHNSWNPDFGLAGDLAHSLFLATNKKVAFEGKYDVMTYHLHDSNSVVSKEALGGLMTDLTVTRLWFMKQHPYLIDKSSLRLVARGAIISKILASAFGLDEKILVLQKYVMDVLRKKKFSFLLVFALLPIRAYFLKNLVRKVVYRRTGLTDIR